MKVTLESTEKLVELDVGHAMIHARIWEGHTDTGIPVHAFITRVGVGQEQDQKQFAEELLKCRAPSPEVAAIPLRLVL